MTNAARAIEIDIKESKQEVGITKRRKKSYVGQQMVMLPGTVAQNVIIRAKRWLLLDVPKLKSYGVQRLVRDVLTISGFIELGNSEVIRRVVLNGNSALARACLKAWRVLLKPEHVSVILGET
jgi:hypothetical protein